MPVSDCQLQDTGVARNCLKKIQPVTNPHLNVHCQKLYTRINFSYLLKVYFLSDEF